MQESGSQAGTPKALSDDDLLMQVGAGDRAAFMALYDRFAARVYGLLVKLMGNRTDAEDTLQTVALDIWKRASTFDPNLSGAATWILMVTRARAIDAIRKRGRTAQPMGDLVMDKAEQAVAEIRASESPKLRAALAQLADDQRSVIELAFHRGLTREEIAGSLGIPVGTVKTRIRAAVKRLGEVIHAEGGRV